MLPRAPMAAVASLVLAVLLAALAGCGDFGDETGSDSPMSPPGETVSFAADIQPIFSSNCVGCHGDGGNAGLDLRSGLAHGNLVNVPATESSLDRIEPGDPQASWLYLKITGRQDVGTQMPPPPSSPLAADATELVRTWIEEGALDN